MTAIEFLRKNGPATALDVALALGITPAEDVYVELVAAEASGDARALPRWKNDKAAPFLWEAM